MVRERCDFYHSEFARAYALGFNPDCEILPDEEQFATLAEAKEARQRVADAYLEEAQCILRETGHHPDYMPDWRIREAC